ncbi:MAG: pseudaminic acid synthase, partial [Lachnospiraceae bacterium]|nr:pseudaminic acid synthase [Lachnospiraceae bacterium]
TGKTYIIAEMSGNHGGSLEKALAIVRAAAKAGADCLKIQTYTADTLTIDCRSDLFKVGKGLWEERYLYDLYQEAYTPWEWTPQIKEETERCGMDFLSTPFDFTAIDYLESIGEEFYKIASFEIVDIPLIRRAAQTGKPLVISCGMAQEEEIQEAVDTVRKVRGCAEGPVPGLVLLKCCSAYPTDYETMHLLTIPDMKQRFQVPVGLSDHSEGSLGAVAAVALGAQVIEKHICLTSEDKTVDSAFSMSADEFAALVRDIRNTEKALGRVSYGPAPEEASSYALRRSLYAVKDIEAGEPFTAENIRSIRPSGGLHTRYYDELISSGKAARRILFGTPLSREDVDGVSF